MIASFASGTCTITVDEVKVEADGTFIISESVKVTDDMRSLIDFFSVAGIPTPAVTPSNSGDTIESKHIDGKFNSATSLVGTYTIVTCGSQFGGSSGETPTWSAEWKRP